MDRCRPALEALLTTCEAFRLIPGIENNFTYNIKDDMQAHGVWKLPKEVHVSF